MSKRQFRTPCRAPKPDPQYPTLEEFDQSRRRFLARLGVTVLGAGTLTAAVAGCGKRAVSTGEDGGAEILLGEPALPDAGRPRQDQGADQTTQPDMGELTMGVEQPPDAQADLRPDMEPLLGDPAPPDARVDHAAVAPDLGPPLQGEMPMPDARVDDAGSEPDQGELTSGFAPVPDARVDD